MRLTLADSPLLLALCCAAGCVLDVPLDDKACDGGHPCIDGFACIDSRCIAPTEGEGEGEGEGGEGEGEEGEGEGEEGEGEGEVIPDVPQRCSHVLALDPTAVSGPYALDMDADGVLDDRDSDGTTTNEDDGIYCNMSAAGGGWILIAYVDQATIAADGCPATWQLEDRSADLGFVGCRRGGPSASAPGVFASAFYPYREVLALVEAVAFGSPDAFADEVGVADSSIDAPYVDGVSLTVGDPREHIFTWASATPFFEELCPCDGGALAPEFVGDDLLCEQPSLAAIDSDGDSIFDGYYFDPSDPQWDGSDNVCAMAEDAANVPFVARSVGALRNDAIELRIMGDQPTDDEDIAVTHIELYVR